MNLQDTDNAAAAVATAPRVTLADIEAAIAARYDTSGEAVLLSPPGGVIPGGEALKLLSLCFLVTRNGFIVVCKSAPASPENFNAELGRKLAYEDAVRQLWPLMGFALRDKLAGF